MPPTAAAKVARAMRLLLRDQADPVAERTLRDLFWKHRHRIVGALEREAAAGDGAGRAARPQARA